MFQLSLVLVLIYFRLIAPHSSACLNAPQAYAKTCKLIEKTEVVNDDTLFGMSVEHNPRAAGIESDLETLVLTTRAQTLVLITFEQFWVTFLCRLEGRIAIPLISKCN